MNVIGIDAVKAATDIAGARAAAASLEPRAAFDRLSRAEGKFRFATSQSQEEICFRELAHLALGGCLDSIAALEDAARSWLSVTDQVGDEYVAAAAEVFGDHSYMHAMIKKAVDDDGPRDKILAVLDRIVITWV